MSNIRIRVLFLIPVALAILGCGSGGPKTARVSGTVTMSGKPLAKVGVTFLPTKKGPAATGVTNENGEFTLTTTRKGDGAVLGKHKVTVGIAEEGQKGLAIPESYGSPHTTKLTAEVQSGKTNAFTFDIEPEAPAPPKKGRK